MNEKEQEQQITERDPHISDIGIIRCRFSKEKNHTGSVKIYQV